MVKGLDVFRGRFAGFEGSFILIGGAACHEWFSHLELAFRATKDLDLVLIIEALSPEFVKEFRQFIDDGGYEIRQRSNETPILYRFAKPKRTDYPYMLELFSRKPEGLEILHDQTVVPIPVDETYHSLSAILIDDEYYQLIQREQDIRDGLPVANVTALILLKARAWHDLTERKNKGEKIDGGDITKHRNDVFRLAGTLPDTSGPVLPTSLTNYLQQVIRAFPEDSADWSAIADSIRPTFGTELKHASLISAMMKFFQLSEE
jgi:hypothetical protein